MSIFGGHRKEKDQDIIIIENLIINPEHDHHHPHHKKIHSFLSKIIFQNRSKTTGKIMAAQFGKAQKVQYVIAFQADDDSPASVRPGSLQISTADTSIATVVQNSTDQLQGEVLGVNDGTTTLNWTALSIGGATVTGTADIIISDEAPQPEAVKTVITFSAPIPQ